MPVIDTADDPEVIGLDSRGGDLPCRPAEAEFAGNVPFVYRYAGRQPVQDRADHFSVALAKQCHAHTVP